MTELAQPAQPLKLRDGTEIDPATGKPILKSTPMVEVPSDVEVQETRKLMISARRKLADLPAMPGTMNAVSAVLCYSLFGLDDQEISLATGIPVERIERMKLSSIYEQYHQQIIDTVLTADQENIRDMFARHSLQAVHTLSREMTKAPKAGDRIKAADSILDRAGHRAADVVMHRMQIEGTQLQIVHVRKDERQSGTDIIDLAPVDEAF
jgi:hypothetical protein